jgi:hypothetical protein
MPSRKYGGCSFLVVGTLSIIGLNLPKPWNSWFIPLVIIALIGIGAIFNQARKAISFFSKRKKKLEIEENN